MFFRFLYPQVWLVLVPLLIGVVWYRWFWFHSVSYQYPLAAVIKKQQSRPFFSFSRLYFWIRLLVLILLSLLVARIQIFDPLSKVHVEGIDIMLVLDVSQSMACCDDPHDPISRIAIAKREAVRFIKKRVNDPIGLVIFGREAASRCPLTLDKHVLQDIVETTDIGVIDSRGTVLSKAILTAANRLRHTKARSNVMVLLTDGEPTDDDSDPRQAIDIAKKLGIKIYTIGIGSDQGGFMRHPQFGLIAAGSYLNKPLLQAIAHETGGKFFEARNKQELRLIYDQIDRLEKTEHESNIFARYRDYFVPVVWFIILCLSAELFLSTFVRFLL